MTLGFKRLFKKDKPLPPPPPTPAACPNCKVRPVGFDTATNTYFDYCTRTCATSASTARVKNSRRSHSGGQSMCENCKQKPKFPGHPYCGRRCAGLAHGAPALKHAPSTLLPLTSSTSPTSPTSSGPTCQTPGCTSPVFAHPDGTLGNYCKVTHKQLGERGCISCRVAPRNGGSILCQPCYDNALRTGPVIIGVPEDHENYKSVESQFKQSWRHKTKCPQVRAVYKIINTETSLKKYEDYLDGVESRGNFVAMGKSRGNENRRWHGTRRTCNLGDKGETEFCTDSSCSLCSIIKTSFDIKFFKGATGWGRFGRGIYTSSTSSKSNDYSRNDGKNSTWKALLLNKVIVGNGKKLIQDDTTLTKPPLNHDSILAEVAPGGTLNYDEVVVYNNDAIRPSYLVMYEES